MTDAVSQPTTGHARVALPIGEMIETPASVRVALSLDARGRGQVQRLLERLGDEGAVYFSLPTLVDDSGPRLVLEYAIEPDSSLPFSMALPRWQVSLAAHVPELVAMARYLAISAQVLARVEVSTLLAPALLRYTPGPTTHPFGAFRLLAVPLPGASLADWARASADVWCWASADVLLGRPAPTCGAYAVGAALFTSLAGQLIAGHSASERFRRALRGQVGARGTLAPVVRAALPGTFGDEGARLTEFVLDLLHGAPPNDWQDQLDELGQQLDPHRTANRWEFEGKIATARAILERLAVTAPKDRVPWYVLARLRTRDHDEAGAVRAVIDALDTGDPEAPRELVVQIRRLTSTDETDEGQLAIRRDMVSRAVDALDKRAGKLGDIARLHLANIEARHLGRIAEARARLTNPARDRWDDVVRRTLLARLHAGVSEWLAVAKHCNDARTAIRSMPAQGGALGSYVIAYLDHLDGVAHFGAIGQYDDAGYFADAFSRFTAAIDGARQVCAPDDPLLDASVHWLAWLANLAHQLQLPTAHAFRAGIEAYLGALGIAVSREQYRQVPPLVWFDEERVLTLSRPSLEDS